MRRSEKTRKLKELQEELSTLDADIHQVEGHAVHDPSLARNSTAELLRRRLREVEEPTTAAARGSGAAAHHHSVLLDGLAATGAHKITMHACFLAQHSLCKLTHPMVGVCVSRRRGMLAVALYLSAGAVS